jgi:hypothetical protein
MKNIEKLIALLRSVGYEPGEEPGQMNIIALLGSIGEAGETLAEYLKQFHSAEVQGIYAYKTMKEIVVECEHADDLKKMIRDGKLPDLHPPVYQFNLFDEKKLDEEIADEFYYLLAKMLNRGKSIEYYAGLTVKKLEGKISQNIRHGVRNLEMPKKYQL